MAVTRPEASETTGTLRDTSGVTVPVTTNSEVVGCWVAVASGNCSGWSTENRAAFAKGTTLASGGAPCAGSASAFLQPVGAITESTAINTRANTGPLPFATKALFIGSILQFTQRSCVSSHVATRAKSRASRHRTVDTAPPCGRTTLELDHDAHAQDSLAPAKIWKPDAARAAASRVGRREVGGPGRGTARTDVLGG